MALINPGLMKYAKLVRKQYLLIIFMSYTFSWSSSLKTLICKPKILKNKNSGPLSEDLPLAAPSQTEIFHLRRTRDAGGHH